MKLYLSRHGQAVAQAATDAERPLTDAGRAALIAHWQSLREHGVVIGGLIVSPYVRAQQSADCIEQVYGNLARQQCEALVPDASPTHFLEWLLTHPARENSVLVSHMPLVAQLSACWTGSQERLAFNVGTVACFDVEVAAANGARLLWLRSPGESVAGR